MAQIRGRKRVKMINAAQLPLLYNHIHCYSEVDLNQIDYERYPLFRQVSMIDLTLNPGEILFLPIGWWHHVTALDISITMSFVNFIYPNNFTQNYTTYSEI
jgi:ribosomal protein L16 Arg81 hydroxylase